MKLLLYPAVHGLILLLVATPTPGLDDVVRNQIDIAGRAIRSSAQRDVEAGERAISLLVESFGDGLMKHIDADDPELRLRVAEIIAQAPIDIRLSIIARGIDSSSQREEFWSFCDRHRGIVRNLLCGDPSAGLDALAKLQRVDHSDQARWLVIAGLTHESDEVVRVSARLARTYPSPEMAHALLDALGTNPERNILDALHRSPAHVPAGLVINMIQDENISTSMRFGLSELLIATGDTRLVPRLIDMLDASPASVLSLTHTGEAISISPADCIFHSAAGLAGLSSHAMGFIVARVSNATAAGFADDAQRARAHENLKQWWARNSHLPPWRNLAEIETPSTSSHSQPHRPVQPRDRRAIEDPLASHAIASRVDQLAGLLASPDVTVRRDAQQQLASLHVELIKAIAATLPDATCRSLAPRLHDIAHRNLALWKMNRNDARQLLALKSRHPLLVTEGLSLDPARRVRGLNRIKTLAPESKAMATLLVVNSLGDGDDLALKQAGLVAIDHEPSDVLTDALLDAIARLTHRQWRDACSDDESTGAILARALARHATPESAGRILAMIRQNGASPFRGPLLAPALVASGQKRLIPTLIDQPGRVVVFFTTEAGTTLAHCDYAIFTIARLAGLDEQRMGMRFMSPLMSGGFDTPRQRESALQSLRTWWNDNRSRQPYTNLEPLDVKRLEIGNPRS